jgi:hypothetical protein
MKIKLLLLLCIATVGLASCKKDTIVQETPNRTIIVEIPTSEWFVGNNGRTITAELEIPEIDQYNVDVEGILVYIDHPVEFSSYIALPYTYQGETFSFEHFNGGITIDIQRSEFATQLPAVPTQPIRVKIVLIPSTDVT